MSLIGYLNELIDRARAKMLRPIDKGADIRLNNGLNPGTRPTAWARSKFIQSSIK